MTEQELNRKLAEWAGFTLHDHMGGTDIDREEYQVDLYDPHGKRANRIPNFTQSLDACFKWLVPTLSHYRLDKTSPKEHHAYVNRSKSAWAGTPALALCLAIEKLINKETERSNGV